MIEWFKNLSDANKIAIVIPFAVAVIGGLFALLKALGTNKSSSPKKKSIRQKGTGHIATMTEGNTTATNVAGRDIHAGIESEAALKTLVETSAKLGRTEKEKEQLRDDIKRLKEIKKDEMKDAFKEIVKEVLIDIRNEKDAT